MGLGLATEGILVTAACSTVSEEGAVVEMRAGMNLAIDSEVWK